LIAGIVSWRFVGYVPVPKNTPNTPVERLVRRAIEHRRAEVFLASKVLPTNASYDGTRAACERSLRRLGTNYLDLYMIHWPSRYPISETMGAMERLVDEGKVRYIGVSNFDVDELSRAQRALSRYRIVANQVLYHLGDRGIENRLLPYCEREGITIVGYSPFGSGRFPSVSSAGGRVLGSVAARHGRTPRQIALSFLVRNPRVVTIPKAAREEHLEAIRAGFRAVSDSKRLILFCHDPTALPYLWAESAVRSRANQIQHTFVGHLHSPLILWKSRWLAGMPTISFLGPSVRRVSSALNRARHWKPFKVRLCPSLAGIELLKDGGFFTADLHEDLTRAWTMVRHHIQR